MTNPGNTAPTTTSKRITKSRGSIFMSYRRDDSATAAGRIHDWLIQRVPKNQIFFDVNSIQYGVDFERHIGQTIPQCKAVLAIIGPNWITAERRPSPHVVMELELARTFGITTIPVLVDSGTLPLDDQLPPTLQGFSKLNAAQVRTGHDFEHDMHDLATSLQISVEPRSLLGPRFWLLMASLVVLLAVGGYGLYYRLSNSYTGTTTNNLYAEATLTNAANNQTATAGAEQASAASAAETATAGAVATSTATAAAPFTYTATAPGTNCGATGQWQSSAVPSSDSQTCSSSGTTLTANGDAFSIAFMGASGFTFPEPYTVSLDVSSMQFSCVTLEVYYQTNAALNGYNLQVCAAGSYTITQVVGATGAGSGPTPVCPAGNVPGASSYHLVVTSNGTSVSFAINSQTVCTQNANIPPASDIDIMDSDVGAGAGTMVVSNFSITPND